MEVLYRVDTSPPRGYGVGQGVVPTPDERNFVSFRHPDVVARDNPPPKAVFACVVGGHRYGDMCGWGDVCGDVVGVVRGRVCGRVWGPTRV